MVSFEYLYDIVFHVKWPIYIAMYIFFTGMSAGSFVLSTLGNVFGIKAFKPLSRIGVSIAVILLALAPLFLIIDLEQPTKFYSTLYYTNPNSVMTWGVYLLSINPINCAIYAWFIFRADFALLANKHSRNFIKRTFYSVLTLGLRDLSDEAVHRDAKFAKALGLIGVPLALCVHGYTCFILAVVEAGVLWHTSLMPPLFLTSAIISGIALFIIIYTIYTRFFSFERKVDTKTTANLAKLMAWALVIDLTLFLCEVIVLANSGAAAQDAIWLLTQGPLAGTFIGMEIVLGGLVPIVLLLYPPLGKRLGVQLFASALILMGILAMRFNIIVGGQFVPLAGGEIVRYNITVEEIQKVLLVVALGATLIYVAFKILPLQPLAKEKPKQKDKKHKAGKAALDGPSNGSGPQEGMDRRTFVRAAMAVGGLLAGVQMGLVGLGNVINAFGSAEAAGTSGDGKKARYAMVVDLTKCIGCHSCTQACKETYDLPPGTWRAWVTKIKKSDGRNEKHLFLPRLCNHCEHPPCVKVCPVQATYKDENGIVLQRYERCIGCKYCMMACPYGMRFVHPRLKVIDKCTFCEHRVKLGLKPACVAACPANARIFGDINDNTSDVSKLVTTKSTTVLKPELGTEPKVFYIDADMDLMEAGIKERK